MLLHSAVQQEATLKQPFQIIQGAFTNIEAGHAAQPHHWDKGIRLVLDALGQAVRDVDTVTVEPDGFYVLMPAATPKQAKHYAADIKKSLDAVIDLKLGLDCSVLNREEVAALVAEKLGR
ncbi:MAG: hypothetical protein EOP83_13870 [Verrucomicrobiaceae bacterium]|nr:MAG: hypothetical protein EOP83_13870 [Verrucomicrobiaceae bacterium]